MNNSTPEKMRPYIEMKNSGASSHEVFERLKFDGWTTSDCMLIVAGIFEMELGDVREIWHDFYRRHKTVKT